MNTTARCITPPAAAEKLGVGVTKVHGWIESGELRAINVATLPSGRPRWVIEPEEFERFKLARSSSPKPKPTRRRKSAFKDYFANEIVEGK